MTDQFNEATGEVIEETVEEASDRPQPQKLSERAAATVEPPAYWRRVDAIQGEGGPDYELAFFEAQAEIEAVIEADAAANMEKFKTKYATLAGLLARVRPVLTKHKLTIKQFPGRVHRLGSDSNRQMFLPVVTSLTHVPSGQGEAFVWEMPVNKVDPQALGSLSTYARRYAIAGIFGIATVDDDAAAASIRNKIDREQGADIVETLIADIGSMKTLADLKKWVATHRDGFEAFSEEKVEKLRAAYEKRKGQLEDTETSQDATQPPANGKPSKVKDR
jgi:hypothetical protein